MSENPQIKVMVVDDHQLLTESLLMVLGEEPDLKVVATAASVAEGVSRFARQACSTATASKRRAPGSRPLAVCRDSHASHSGRSRRRG